MTPAMTHSRFVGSLQVLLAAAACTVMGCSSSGGGSPDSGVFTGQDGSSGGGGDVKVLGPFDATSLDDAGATSTCTAFEAYEKCNTTDPCAALDAKDCVLFDGIYSTAGRKAVSGCYSSSSVCGPDAGDVTECLAEAALQLSPDTEQKKLATDFCAACPTDGSSCAGDFYSNIADDAGNIGLGATLGLTLISDATIKMIDSSCVGSLTGGMQDCGFTFASCVGPIINPPAATCEVQMMGGGDGGSDADPGGA